MFPVLIFTEFSKSGFTMFSRTLPFKDWICFDEISVFGSFITLFSRKKSEKVTSLFFHSGIHWKISSLLFIFTFFHDFPLTSIFIQLQFHEKYKSLLRNILIYILLLVLFCLVLSSFDFSQLLKRSPRNLLKIALQNAGKCIVFGHPDIFVRLRYYCLGLTNVEKRLQD